MKDFIAKQVAYLLVFGIDMGLAWVWHWSMSTTMTTALVMVVVWNQCRELVDRADK